MARDHTHRNSGGNIVIGKPGKPDVGDLVKVGGHIGRVVDDSPWGGARWVNPPAYPKTDFKPSLDEDVAIQVIQDKAECQVESTRRDLGSPKAARCSPAAERELEEPRRHVRLPASTLLGDLPQASQSD